MNGAPARLKVVKYNGLPAARTVTRWSGRGDRWEVVVNAPLHAEPVIANAVIPVVAAPGDRVTYTLTYSNAGDLSAARVIITGLVPPEIGEPISFSTGRARCAR